MIYVGSKPQTTIEGSKETPVRERNPRREGTIGHGRWWGGMGEREGGRMKKKTYNYSWELNEVKRISIKNNNLEAWKKTKMISLFPPPLLGW